MPATGYTGFQFTSGEQPTTAKWNLGPNNDASFNTGEGFNDGIIQFRHLASDIFPTGLTLMYPGTGAPSANWLVCNGAAVSRTTYSALFALIGTLYGNGNGSTTFNIPNFKHRVPAGLDSTDTNFATLGQQGGESAHVLTTAELAAHSHGINDPGHGHGVNDPGHAHGSTRNFFADAGGAGNLNMSGGGNGFAQGQVNVQTTGSGTGIFLSGSGTGISIQNTGSGTAHNNLQPYTTINFIIKT
jgi:microcystin-dependent protein